MREDTHRVVLVHNNTVMFPLNKKDPVTTCEMPCNGHVRTRCRCDAALLLRCCTAAGAALSLLDCRMHACITPYMHALRACAHARTFGRSGALVQADWSTVTTQLPVVLAVQMQAMFEALVKMTRSMALPDTLFLLDSWDNYFGPCVLQASNCPYPLLAVIKKWEDPSRAGGASSEILVPQMLQVPEAMLVLPWGSKVDKGGCLTWGDAC
jgi:hypothetical protein